MKNTLFVAALVMLAMTSCKKDYECECTNSSTAPGSTSTTYKYTLVEASKAQAKANCFKTTEEETSGGQTYTTTNDCKLK